MYAWEVICIFLGWFITPDGVKPLFEKTKIIVNFPKSETISQLRRFLVMMANFYRLFYLILLTFRLLFTIFLKIKKIMTIDTFYGLIKPLPQSKNASVTSEIR